LSPFRADLAGSLDPTSKAKSFRWRVVRWRPDGELKLRPGRQTHIVADLVPACVAPLYPSGDRGLRVREIFANTSILGDNSAFGHIRNGTIRPLINRIFPDRHHLGREKRQGTEMAVVWRRSIVTDEHELLTQLVILVPERVH